MSVKKSIPKRSQKKKKKHPRLQEIHQPITFDSWEHNKATATKATTKGRGLGFQQSPTPRHHTPTGSQETRDPSMVKRRATGTYQEKKHLKITLYKWFLWGGFPTKAQDFCCQTHSYVRFFSRTLIINKQHHHQSFAPLRFPGETSWIRRTFLGEISKEWCNDRFRIYFHGRISSFETET